MDRPRTMRRWKKIGRLQAPLRGSHEAPRKRKTPPSERFRHRCTVLQRLDVRGHLEYQDVRALPESHDENALSGSVSGGKLSIDIPVESLKPPKGPALDPRELGLARQLIEMLEAEFDPHEYHDEFRERVLEMVAAKAQGKQVKKHVPMPHEPDMDLSQALEASILQVRKHA